MAGLFTVCKNTRPDKIEPKDRPHLFIAIIKNLRKRCLRTVDKLAKADFQFLVRLPSFGSFDFTDEPNAGKRFKNVITKIFQGSPPVICVSKNSPNQFFANGSPGIHSCTL